MTIVIGTKRDEEILLVADTMVDDPGKTGPNVFPGRLKLVTIGQRVTVAFAGNADPAGVAVRFARRELRRSGLAAAVDALRDASSDGGIDFLVATHDPAASLVRLQNGFALDVSDICALGHDEPFQDLIDNARGSSDGTPLRKSDLVYKFLERLLTNKELGCYVGGFPMAVEARSIGHRYLPLNGTYIYNIPNLKWGEEAHQSIEDVYTGAGHFTFSVIPSDEIDVPVVGACLLQARTGFVFSPIEQPEAFTVQLALPGSSWMGQEQQMFDVLKGQIAKHVATVPVTV